MHNHWKTFLTDRGLSEDALSFGDASKDVIAARDGTVLVPLVDLGLIRASGEDAAAFLHNLLSNDVKSIAPDGVRLAGFCSAKGRLLATMLIWRDGPDYVLALSDDICDAILKKLSMYILRSKVKLSTARDDYVLLGLAGNNAAEALGNIGAAAGEAMKAVRFAGGTAIALGHNRYLIAVDASQAEVVWEKLTAHARPAGLAAWHWLEIAAGVPRVVMATQEAFVPQMVNLEVVGGVSFTKGCYPGQEIVARAQYLGKVKRRMFRARIEQPAKAGDALFAPSLDAQSCGELVEVAPSPDGGYECLAVMQTSCAEAGDVHVGSVDGQRLTLTTLPYAVP